MKPTAKQLALRDPALAAMLGLVGTSDFGVEFGDDYGCDGIDEMHGEESPFGVEFGDDYGSDWGAEAAALAPVAQQGVQALVAEARQRRALTAKREALLEPNKGSGVKIQRYSFAINATLALGTTSTVTATGQPDTNIRPQRVTMNAPAPGFVTINEIKVANVSVTVGGIHDAFDFSTVGVGQALDMPTLSPANRASVLGTYTGYVPTGYTAPGSYLFVVSFKGPASIVA